MERQRKRVGVVLEEGAEYSLRLMDGIAAYAAEHPHIHLLAYGYEGTRAPGWLRRRPDCDGWLLWAASGKRWVERLLATGRPVVNACGGWPVERVAGVAFSLEAVATTALDYLAGLGRTTLAFVTTGAASDRAVKEMHEVLPTMARARGLEILGFDLDPQPGLFLHPPRLTRQAAAALRGFLRQLSLPAAIWTQDDGIAMAVMATAQGLGLRVPEQLAVLGTGDWAAARFCQPSLSSIPQPGRLVGFEAMALLDRLMAGAPLPAGGIAIATPPVVVRESTGLAGDSLDRLALVHDFILEHACQAITAEDVVTRAQMSAPTLRARFVARYGRTPAEEIRRVRLAQAQKYLRTTALPVARISDLCGYGSTANFLTFFKRQTGRTPSQYRQGLHELN